MTNLTRTLAALAVTGAAILSPHGPARLAAQQSPPSLDAAARRTVVDSLRSLLVRVYVDADTGRLIAEHLRAQQAAGAYDQFTDPGEFGRALTRDLRAINEDTHLGAGFAPEAPVDRLGPDGLQFAGEQGGEDAAAVEAQARGFHFGLGKLELLAGNVGYAELTGFFDGDAAERMMLAALEYLRDADAIIFDLRGHGGGSGDMSNWLLSHFLEGDSLLTLRVAERVNDRTVDRYTLAEVPGPRRPDVPVFILTSGATASAAEDFTFILDNLGRAVVVGDTTAGAGHNNTLLALGHGMIASISFSRVTDPATGREWERVGIAPDLAVSAGDALAVAHLAALDTLITDTQDPAAARRLELLRETTAARHVPHRVPEARLRGYAGTYGDRRITFSGSGLQYQRGGGREVAMVALSDSTFALESVPTARLEFRGTGAETVLVVSQPGGRSMEVPRTPPSPAQPGPSTPPAGREMSTAAREYLTAALDTLQSASMHVSTDWALVRDSAFVVAAAAERPRDTYAAIQWALKRVDRHSYLQASRGQVNPALVAGRFGYLRVPFYNGPVEAPLADSLQSALRTLESGGACGWIVDLRMNGGGNVWPMQVGIAPLIGDSVITREAIAGRRAGYTVYVEGAAIAVEANGERTVVVRVNDPYVMRHPDAPVAVLIDGATGSSAEAIAIAFRPRPATRFFGVATAGYSTVNRGASLPDGANMVITVGTMADRTGRAYGGPIEPDELIEVAEGAWPTSRDVVARRAADWLAAQPGCSDAQSR